MGSSLDWLSWTRLGGADHKAEALKKCYKEGGPLPIGPALSTQQSDTNCSDSCFLFLFARHPHWCPELTYGERGKAALPTACVIVCSLEGGCPAEAGVCFLAVEPWIEATVGPGHPGSALCASVFRGWGPVFEERVCSPLKQICMWPAAP